MMRIWWVILVFGPLSLIGQIGGTRSYDFLNLPANAKVSALGGLSITSLGPNNQWLANPAILDSTSQGGISINFLNYFAGSSYSNVTYGFDTRSLPLSGMAVGFQYLGHGQLEAFDPTGESLGTFQANELAFTVGGSHEAGPFRLGANLKFSSSNIDAFSSSAVMMDIGGIFYPTANENFVVGLAMKNFGIILTEYSETSESRLPFDVQLGTTFKPQYMPVRFTVTAYNLAREDVVFFDQQLAGTNDSEPGTSEQIFRRLNFGAEFLLGDNFQLMAGYNHLTRKELRLNQVSGGAGFSFGFLLKIKRISLYYGRAFYHVAGASNFFSLNTNVNNFIKKK